MFKQDALPPIAPLPADASPETRAAYEATYLKAGYTKEQIAAGTGAPAPEAKVPTGTVIPGTNVQIAPGPDDGLTVEERGKLADALRRHWTGDPAELERALTGEGADASEAPGERYALNYGEHAQAVPPDELAALDNMFQQGLRNASIPQAHAQPIVQAMLDSTDKYENLSDEQAKLEHAHQGALIRRVAGDDVEAFMATANTALMAMGKDIHDILLENKALHTAEVWVALYNAGKALEARGK